MGEFRGRMAIRSSERRRWWRSPMMSEDQRRRPPSMMASALSRDTKSVQAASGLFSLDLRGTLLFLSFRPRLARESNGGIWFHQPSIRPPTSDHDSFFRRRDRSREQGAQSA